MSKIAVVGSLNVDLVTKTNHLPSVGETIRGESFQTICGGKGANQAFAAAKMGANVTMFGCVGNDSFASELLNNLASVGIDCSNIKRQEGISSGTAVITVCDGNNSIIINAGANGLTDTVYMTDHWEQLKQADMIILQLEIPIETILAICKYAKKNHIPVMLNPSPVVDLPDEVFSGLDYLIVNEIECEYYTGLKVESVEDAAAGVQHLLARGCKTAIVTLGDKGAVYNTNTGIEHFPARKVKAVDSTAAGDTFAAAVAAMVTDGNDISTAVKFATNASAIVVTRLGAQTSIPDRAEVEENLKEE